MKAVEFASLFEFIRNGMSVKQDKSGEGLPITRIETIAKSAIDPTRVGYAGLHEAKISRWLLAPGDILFSHINSVEHLGKCAVYCGQPDKLVHGMNLLCLRPDRTKISPDFAKYLIRSEDFRSRLANSVKKAVNQASVSIRDLGAIPVALPPLPQQVRIAAILDQADALREKRRTALTYLEALESSLFEEMFEREDAGSDLWPKLEVRNALAIPLRNGISPSTAGQVMCDVLTLSAITGGAFDQSAKKQGAFAAAVPAEKRVLQSEFLICRGNGNANMVGRGFYPDVNMPDTAFPDTMIAARFDPALFHARYIQSLWNRPKIREQVRSCVRTTNGTFKINQGGIEAIVISQPPINVQAEFGRRMGRFRLTARAVFQHAAKLDALFASLQHRAFRGEL